MTYNLPSGKQIVLEDVIRVSKIRDQSTTDTCVFLSKLTFSIYLNGESTIEITEPYHFSDWSEKKLKLNQLRSDLVSRWKQVVKDGDDS